MKQMQEYQVLYVEWIDHYSEDDWFKKNDLVERMKNAKSLCKTIGYLVNETDNWLSLASTLYQTTDVTCIMNIYKPCIVKRKKVMLP